MTGFFGSSDSSVLLSLKPRIVEVRKRAFTDLNNVDELVELLMDHYGHVTDRDSLSSTLAKKAKQGVLIRQVI